MKHVVRPWSSWGLEDVFISATHCVTDKENDQTWRGFWECSKKVRILVLKKGRREKGEILVIMFELFGLMVQHKGAILHSRESAQIKEERRTKMGEQGLLFFTEYLFLFSPLPSVSCLCHRYLCKDLNQDNKQQRVHKQLLPWCHNTWTARKAGRSWHKQLISSLNLLSVCDLSFCPAPVLCAV